MERITYDGNRRKILLKNYSHRIVSFDVFERKLFLLIAKTNNTNVNNSELIETSINSSALIVFDVFFHKEQTHLKMDFNQSFNKISIIHRQRQPLLEAGQNPCAINNGGCHHLCLIKYENHVPLAKCQCSTGYYLNNSKCHLDQSKNKLIYVLSRPGSIKMISLPDLANLSLNLTNQNHIKMSTIPLTRPVAVEYDHRTSTIFYSNIERYVINNYILDYTAKSQNYASVFIDKGVIRCEALAIDPLGRNLYWTDSAMLAISVANLDNSNFRKRLITTELFHPKSITIDFANGKIYWSDWTFYSNYSGKIELSSMNGEQRQVIVGKDLTYPNGLVINNEYIYWCDSYSKRLERAHLDGSNREV